MSGGVASSIAVGVVSPSAGGVVWLISIFTSSSTTKISTAGIWKEVCSMVSVS